MESQQQNNERVIVYVRMQLYVGFGRSLYIVGDSDEIGKWNIGKAYRLTWTNVPPIMILGRYLARILHYPGWKSIAI